MSSKTDSSRKSSLGSVLVLKSWISDRIAAPSKNKMNFVESMTEAEVCEAKQMLTALPDRTMSSRE